MKFLFKVPFWGKYDPFTYWSERENPNNSEGERQERVNFDVEYIRGAIGDVNSILELGPGVGRTFAAYTCDSNIATLDISTNYAEKLLSVADALNLHLTQQYLKPRAPFPFEDQSFNVGVASQVLLHVPPESIEHTLSELVRVCEKIVIITAYKHEPPCIRLNGNHVFNHDYFSICTSLGCVMNNVVMNDGRILFTAERKAL